MEERTKRNPVLRTRRTQKPSGMRTVSNVENRTVWTETQIKLGATRVVLRPRSLGFGLRCNPNVHQVLKAARIKDYSVKCGVVGIR